MMGYGNDDGALIQHQGYRLFDPDTMTFFYSADVKFPKPYQFEMLENAEELYNSIEPQQSQDHDYDSDESTDSGYDTQEERSVQIPTGKTTEGYKVGKYTLRSRLAQTSDEYRNLKYYAFAALVNKTAPRTLKEATKRPDSTRWLAAYENEMDTMLELKVWDSVTNIRLEGRVIGTRIILLTKLIQKAFILRNAG